MSNKRFFAQWIFGEPEAFVALYASGQYLTEQWVIGVSSAHSRHESSRNEEREVAGARLNRVSHLRIEPQNGQEFIRVSDGIAQ